VWSLPNKIRSAVDLKFLTFVKDCVTFLQKFNGGFMEIREARIQLEIIAKQLELVEQAEELKCIPSPVVLSLVNLTRDIERGNRYD
jgi:hypothetical protein